MEERLSVRRRVLTLDDRWELQIVARNDEASTCAKPSHGDRGLGNLQLRPSSMTMRS